MTKQSDNIATLAKAIIAVQAELAPVKKDKDNPFFHSRYVGLDTVMPMALALLNKHGLALVQTVGNGIDPTAIAGVGTTLTTMLIHESGEYIADTQPLLLVKNDPQGQGSAITYARRYGLMSMLGIVAEDDDDGNAASRPSPAQQYQEAVERGERPEPQRRAAGPMTEAKAMTSQYAGKCYDCGNAYAQGDSIFFMKVDGKSRVWHRDCYEIQEP